MLVFYTHRENIGRLLRGEENRMSFAGREGIERMKPYAHFAV